MGQITEKKAKTSYKNALTNQKLRFRVARTLTLMKPEKKTVQNSHNYKFMLNLSSKLAILVSIKSWLCNYFKDV